MIAFLIAKLVARGVAPRFAPPLLAMIGAALLVAALLGGKCAYDRSVIKAHDATRDAAIAKADRKADAKSAEERRADDARASTETAEIKEAIDEAGPDPAARRPAYYECVRLQQAARAGNQPPANC